MTTHDVANLFDHFRVGLGVALKDGAATEFGDLSAALRDLPDQKLSQLVKDLRALKSPPTPRPGRTPAAAPAGVDVPAIVNRIKAIRDGSNGPTAADIDLTSLNNNHLKEVLRSFSLQPTNTSVGNLAKVKDLIRPIAATNGAHPPVPLNGTHPPADGPAEPADPRAVEEAVGRYDALLNDRALSIPAVRAGFEPLRAYPKPVVAEVHRRVGYSGTGSKPEMLQQLQSHLEGIKLSQHRADGILAGA